LVFDLAAEPNCGDAAALIALLFIGGVMNIIWIAGLTIFVLLEKVVPLG